MNNLEFLTVEQVNNEGIVIINKRNIVSVYANPNYTTEKENIKTFLNKAPTIIKLIDGNRIFCSQHVETIRLDLRMEFVYIKEYRCTILSINENSALIAFDNGKMKLASFNDLSFYCPIT